MGSGLGAGGTSLAADVFYLHPKTAFTYDRAYGGGDQFD
jgi:hypothetical protein